MPKSNPIPYEQLTPAEKDIVDHGGQVTENTRKRRKELQSIIDEYKLDEPRELTEEEKELKREKVRFNEQAFLMLSMNDFIEQSKQEKRFTQFAQIDYDKPAELNNRLFKRKPEYDILLNTTSAQMSYFVPKIRLFKEYKINNEIVSVEFPISNGYFDQDFKNILESKAGRGGGVGLKSLNWSTIGNSSGNQYTFSADIELFFESIEQITAVRRIDPDIMVPNSQGINAPLETSFADLLIQKKQKNSSGQYNVDYYRVKAIVGWEIPRESRKFLPDTLIREFEYANLPLYLGLHSHEINIQDDSSVVLKLKYIAYLEALTDNPQNSNVLYPDENDVDTKDIIGLKSLIENLNNQAEKEEDESVKESISKSIDENRKKLDSRELSSKTKIYQRMLNYIYKNNNLKYIKASEDDFQTYTKLVNSNSFSDEEQIKAYNETLEKIRANNKSNMNSKNSFPVSTAAGVSVPSSPEQITDVFKKKIEDYDIELQKEITKINETKEKAKIIPYFFLGDLLESVLYGMYGQGKQFLDKEMKVLLGPVLFYDYGRLIDGGLSGAPRQLNSQLNNSEQKIKEYTGQASTPNIADIPISLSVYTNWFLKKIIDPGIVTLNFKDFINKILNDLVIKSVGAETYSFAPRQKTKLVYKTKTLRRKTENFFNVVDDNMKTASMSEALNKNDVNSPKYFRYNALDLNPFVDSPSIDKKYKLDNLMFIYGTANNGWELRSKYSEDIVKGIRHIYYGNETGLITSIKFNRQDNPLIRSHNMKLASTQNGQSTIILREVYNATVDMMGNNLFEIGELVYVSPTLFGMSKKNISIEDREEFAKELGIGGYFMILKINSKISEGSFTTSLDLVWNARGDGIPNNINDGTGGKVSNDKGLKIR